MSIWDILGSQLSSNTRKIGGLFTTPVGGGGTAFNPESNASWGGYDPNQPVESPSTPSWLERNVFGKIRAVPTNFAPRPTSIADIMAELQRLQDPNRYMTDPSLLQQQAEASASAQYDPIIAALRGQASSAQRRASRNTQQLGSMYTGLSNSLMSDIAPIQQQFTDTQAKTGQQYQDLQNKIKNQYASSQAEQEAMMKRLNIEAAAPQALAGQQSDRDFLVSNAATEGQNVQSQLAQQGAGAVNYTRQGSELARTEGTNRQADLMSVLADYLQGIEGQIGSNEAAKSASIQGNLASLMQQSQNDATSRAQRDFENYAKTIGIMQSLQKGGQTGSVQSPVDVAPRVMGFGLNANSAQQVQNAFMTAISSDPLVQSSIDPTSGMGLSKEALATRVVEVGRSRGLNSQELNALQNAALEYFGRR
jgi:hypothetical protein